MLEVYPWYQYCYHETWSKWQLTNLVDNIELRFAGLDEKCGFFFHYNLYRRLCQRKEQTISQNSHEKFWMIVTSSLIGW